MLFILRRRKDNDNVFVDFDDHAFCCSVCACMHFLPLEFHKIALKLHSETPPLNFSKFSKSLRRLLLATK
jgi:hypothetical protein